MGAARELAEEVNGHVTDGPPTSLLAFWLDEEKETVRDLGNKILTAREDLKRQHEQEERLEQKIKDNAKAAQAQRQRAIDAVLGEREDGVEEIPLVESRTDLLTTSLSRLRANMKEAIKNEEEFEAQRRGVIFDANTRAREKLYGLFEESARRVRSLYILVSAADAFAASAGVREGGLNHATWQQTTISAQPHMSKLRGEIYPKVFSREVLLHGPSEVRVAAKVADQCKWDIEKELCPAGTTIDLRRKG